LRIGDHERTTVDEALVGIHDGDVGTADDMLLDPESDYTAARDTQRDVQRVAGWPDGSRKFFDP
jgi:hypothetical protein